MKKFVIASGGTGGHFYPGFALGVELRNRGHKVLFVVRKEDRAIKTLEKNKFDYKEIDLSGFPRSINPFRHIMFVYRLFKSYFQTKKIMADFAPDAAVGMGGYVSFPVILVAKIKGIKSAVHDSNTKVGLANKICAKFTDLVLLGLPSKDRFKKSLLVGTPIREEFTAEADREKTLSSLKMKPDMATVLIFGGSQGSKNLNLAVAKAVKKLMRKNDTMQFIHITGDRGFDRMKQEYRGVKNVKMMSYSNEIYALIQCADMLVCRSGASTIAEIYHCKKPSVLVPFPHAAGDHQYYNALLLRNAGVAELMEEGKDLDKRLYTYLLNISRNKNILEFMTRGFEKLELPDPMKAAAVIADTVESL
ncbi:UDP-N-acetylglucosamine--N-acetylmuramyl-(pentapeptide) pyrophosphoryl-undecaprenol N-acetylglucosamine transferase [Parelusimicrobium proximum]|uniref:UDP-N-acetylglucosamine--N-acetylmuramyl- (pentapeptide) pyrophosphoryl-undecaprenol N-acetylglucosamine transferase n=1 Tax=Parelusimicrobium proximum TaxID=3228953 RepID=UPI003D17DD53